MAYRLIRHTPLCWLYIHIGNTTQWQQELVHLSAVSSVIRIVCFHIRWLGADLDGLTRPFHSRFRSGEQQNQHLRSLMDSPLDEPSWG